jgi:hypothetical protein
VQLPTVLAHDETRCLLCLDRGLDKDNEYRLGDLRG